MNKPKSKAKLFLVPAPGSKVPARRPKTSSVTADPQTIERLATVEFWKEEIAGLQSGQFESAEKATEKLIEQVLERLKLKKSGEEDVKEFLRLVFESSEVLQSTLKKALKLK